MRYFFLILCCLPLCSTAQKITFSGDTLLSNGKPYALLIEEAPTGKTTFSLQTLEGDALMEIVMEEGGVVAFQCLFIGMDDYTARIVPSIPYKSTIAREIVQCRLINADMELEEKAVAKFCKLNHREPAASENTASGDAIFVPADYQLVDRNISEPVTCASGNIRQDKKLIGKYKYESRSAKGLTENIVSFYAIQNTKLAEVRYTTGAKTCTLHTLKDNRKTTIEIAVPAKTIDEVVAHLIDMGYL